MKIELCTITLNYFKGYGVDIFRICPGKGRERVSLGFDYSLFNFWIMPTEKDMCLEILFFFHVHLVEGVLIFGYKLPTWAFKW